MLKALLLLLLNKLVKVLSAEGDPSARKQPPKKQTRYTYTDGPMYFLGQQIVRLMQDAGWDAKIHQCYRPPEEQEKYFAKGTSKVRAWGSAHQYMEAVDIIHRVHGWNVPETFWDELAAAVEVVSEKYNVALNHGHHWRWRDSAHIQTGDWKGVKAMVGEQKPTQTQLDNRFAVLLPQVWKQHQRSIGGILARAAKSA